MFCWVYHSKYISGWWYPSEKYDFVSWEYYSQLNGIKLMFQATNQ